MILSSVIKKSFTTTFKNPTIPALFILYHIGSYLLSAFAIYSKAVVEAFVLIVVLFLFISLFLAGWFETIKTAYINKENDENTNLWQVFSYGISKNFAKTTIGLFIFAITLGLFIYLAQVAASRLWGNIDDIIAGVRNSQDIIKYFNSLAPEQMNKVYVYNFCFMVAILIFSFASLFYFPTILDENKCEKLNCFIKPFASIWYNLIFAFKHFFGDVAIVMFGGIMLIALSNINMFFMPNVIIFSIVFVLKIYFVSAVIMIIFGYYEEKNNSNNRLDCIGQNETFDSNGENN